MRLKRLGKTDLKVSEVSFGALPIQRTDMNTSVKILQKAYHGGVNFYDSAHGYSDSEEKLGCALSEVRNHVIIATKTQARTKNTVLEDLETSLRRLKTDYIDIFQLHSIQSCPDPNDEDGQYAALAEAKRKGYVRFIGVTGHRMPVLKEALHSGLFDTIQYPLSYLSTDEEISFTFECAKADIGYIAMKGLAGGLVSSALASYAFMGQYDHIVPIWGIQLEKELDEFLQYAKSGIKLNDELKAIINKDKVELAGNFCRGCGYCLPCPADIRIPFANRMALLLQRAPAKDFITDEWNEKMQKINSCIECRSCVSRCPYSIDIPNTLKENLNFYNEFRNNFLKQGKS